MKVANFVDFPTLVLKSHNNCWGRCHYSLSTKLLQCLVDLSMHNLCWFLPGTINIQKILLGLHKAYFSCIYPTQFILKLKSNFPKQFIQSSSLKLKLCQNSLYSLSHTHTPTHPPQPTHAQLRPSTLTLVPGDQHTHPHWQTHTHILPKKITPLSHTQDAHP